MPIVRSNYRPKRAPRKKRPRTYPAEMPVIMEAKPKRLKRAQASTIVTGPVIIEAKSPKKRYARHYNAVRTAGLMVATTALNWLRQWWARYRAEGARLRWQDDQPARYTLVAVQRATTVAKWLAGLSGAALVLAFAFYIQAYLSIPSIKDDCVARLFVADAIKGALLFAWWALVAGVLALVTISLPALVGVWRNRASFGGRRRRMNQPPLELGHELDGLTEWHVSFVAGAQAALLFFSCGALFLLVFGLLYFGIGSKPEGIQKGWHEFELKCLPQPPDQGIS